MGERADACRRRANDCELAASRVKDPDVRTVYLDMAILNGVFQNDTFNRRPFW